MLLPTILGVGIGVWIITLAQLLSYLIKKRNVPIKYKSYINYLISSGQQLNQLAQNQPTDLADYLTFTTAHYPTSPLIVVRLKNDNPKVADISVEPWGAADLLPYGANYYIVLSVVVKSLPHEPILFPEQIVCTPDWKGFTETVIGDFELDNVSLILHVADFVGNIAIFTEEGVGTVAFG